MPQAKRRRRSVKGNAGCKYGSDSGMYCFRDAALCDVHQQFTEILIHSTAVELTAKALKRRRLHGSLSCGGQPAPAIKQSNYSWQVVLCNQTRAGVLHFTPYVDFVRN